MRAKAAEKKGHSGGVAVAQEVQEKGMAGEEKKATEGGRENVGGRKEGVC